MDRDIMEDVGELMNCNKKILENIDKTVEEIENNTEFKR